MKNHSVPSTPEQVQEHLQQAKSFSNEVIAQEKQLQEIQRSARLLKEKLCDLGADDKSMQNIDDLVTKCSAQFGSVNAFAASRCNSLQKLLLESQDVHEGIDGLLVWIKDTEGALNNMRPLSLNEETLNDQKRELHALRLDMKSHQPAVDSVKRSGSKVVKSSDPDMAHEIEDKLSELDRRFKAVLARASERDRDINDVSEKLTQTQDCMKTLDDWLIPTLNVLESSDFSQLDTPLYQEKVSNIGWPGIGISLFKYSDCLIYIEMH